LNHQTPIQALKKWQTEKPELFVKRVYKQAGLDNYMTDIKKILATSLCLVFALSGCDYIPTPENQAKQAVKNLLIDPGSAKFDNVFRGKSTDSTTTTYCGFVNSKNRMGGYAGKTPFIVKIIGDYHQTEIIQPPPTNSDFHMYLLSNTSSEKYLELIDKCEGPKKWEESCGTKIFNEVNKLCPLMDNPSKFIEALHKEFP